MKSPLPYGRSPHAGPHAAILPVVRVAITTAGSRGEVAPSTSLGLGLSRAGHEVTLATHGCFAGLVEGSGVAFPRWIPRTELESSRGRGLHRGVSGPGKPLRMLEMARRPVGRMADDLVAAARSSDVLPLSGSLAPIGHTLTEGLRLPSMGVHLQPLTPKREFAPPLLGGGAGGAPRNPLVGPGGNQAGEAGVASPRPPHPRPGPIGGAAT
ncbi:glycosyltransferase, partial [Streptomyces sp. NPDC054804]